MWLADVHRKSVDVVTVTLLELKPSKVVTPPEVEGITLGDDVHVP